ncbi:MAG: hypothetical protein ABI685_04495 [Ferruginibacter sp.]
MNKINSSLTIGTVGIILTAVLQIIMTLFISGNILDIVFFILYPVFIIFLAVGFWKILKEKKLHNNFRL